MSEGIAKFNSAADHELFKAVSRGFYSYCEREYAATLEKVRKNITHASRKGYNSVVVSDVPVPAAHLDWFCDYWRSAGFAVDDESYSANREVCITWTDEFSVMTLDSDIPAEEEESS